MLPCFVCVAYKMQQDPQGISGFVWILQDLSQGLANQRRGTVQLHITANQHKAYGNMHKDERFSAIKSADKKDHHSGTVGLRSWPNLPSWKDERTACCPEAFSWRRRGRRWLSCRSAGLCRKHERTFWRQLRGQATTTPAHTEHLQLERPG